MLKQIQFTAAFIRKQISIEPEAGIILGSGLGGLVSEINIEHAIDYSDIPNFPMSTVEGHAGKLVFGKLGGKNVVAMQGRFHFYEGYPMQELTFPVRVMKYLGIKKLLLSNASGGMNLNYRVGDIVIINDHINLMPANPLIGKNDAELGPRFPDMSEAYDQSMVSRAKKIADKNNFRAHIGVYAAVSGPCFETPAEYKYLRIIGADIVGMSTVPEVMVARHMGIPCFAISIVTDLGGHEEITKVSHEEVLKVAKEAEKKLTTVVKELLQEI